MVALATPLADRTAPELLPFAQPSPGAEAFPQGQRVAEPSPVQNTVPGPLPVPNAQERMSLVSRAAPAPPVNPT